MTKNCQLAFVEDFCSSGHENDISSMIKTDNICSICLHEKFLVIGGISGRVSIFDHLGNFITSLPQFKTAIKSIDLDAYGNYIAILTKDWQISVIEVTSRDEDCTMEYRIDTSFVVIHPEFGPKNRLLLVASCDKLILLQKNWFGDKRNIIHISVGPIAMIRWKGRFILCASTLVVDAYDFELGQLIGRINLLLTPHPSPVEDVSVNLIWKDSLSFFVVCGHLIKLCVITRRTYQDLGSLPAYAVELAHELSLSTSIQGSCLLQDKLACIHEIHVVNSDREAERKVLEFRLELHCADLLHGSQELECEDFRIEYSGQCANSSIDAPTSASKRLNDASTIVSLSNERKLFVVLPSAIFTLRLHTLDDIVDALLEQNLHLEALEQIENHTQEASRNLTEKIGIAFLQDCAQRGLFELTSEVLPKSFQNNITLWEKAVVLFMQYCKVQYVAPLVPCSMQLHLAPHYYNEMLTALIRQHQELFMNCIERWPSSLYDSEHVMSLFKEPESNEMTPHVLRAQAILFIRAKNYIKALQVYIQLRDRLVFYHIHKHKLEANVIPYIEGLLAIDQNDAIQLFVKNLHVIPASIVVKALCNSEPALCLYFSKMHLENSSLINEYTDIQIALYVKYSREKLLPFLRESSTYDIPKARDLCQKAELHHEYAFLCERMGDTRTALRTYIEDMNNVDEAISICNRLQDDELLNELIDYCLIDPKKICALLTDPRHSIDPVHLIEKFPSGFEVDSLKSVITNLFANLRTKMSLLQSYGVLLSNDSRESLSKKIHLQREGAVIDVNTLCSLCFETIITGNLAEARKCVVFLCGHGYHQQCIVARIGRDDQCAICIFGIVSSNRGGVFRRASK